MNCEGGVGVECTDLKAEHNPGHPEEISTAVKARHTPGSRLQEAGTHVERGWLLDGEHIGVCQDYFHRNLCEEEQGISSNLRRASSSMLDYKYTVPHRHAHSPSISKLPLPSRENGISMGVRRPNGGRALLKSNTIHPIANSWANCQISWKRHWDNSLVAA